jgi:AraC-like DNA-binding protein
MIKLTSAFMNDCLDNLNYTLKEKGKFNCTTKWGSVEITAALIADVRLFIIEFDSNEVCSVTVEMNRASLMLNFTLLGQYQLLSENQKYCAECTHEGLVSTDDLRSTLMFQGHLKIFIICFQENSLKQAVIDDLCRNHLSLLQLVRPITAQMSQVIQGIMDNMGKKGRHHIYAEAKVLELLSLELEQLETLSGQPGNQLWKEQDQDRIRQAKMIIEQNLINPCSLIELAHKVGLNDFKLKKGFREVLGTTVFGYLYDLRMNKATLLLKEGKLVRDVAYEVGYKNAHHFTVAFKKKFGYLPSKVTHFLGLCFLYISVY